MSIRLSPEHLFLVVVGFGIPELLQGFCRVVVGLRVALSEVKESICGIGTPWNSSSVVSCGVIIFCLSLATA